MERLCKNCQFWLQQAPEDITGQCRRYPPHLPQNEMQQTAMRSSGSGPFAGVWPDTLGVDWCGEFQPTRQVTLEQPLSILGLTTQTLNLLNRAGIRTVRDLTARTAADLKTIAKFGDVRLREVQEKLASHRFALKQPPPADKT